MIVVKDLYKRYRTSHGYGDWVLRGLSIDIPTDVNIGLVGRNGAGKSTLLRLIGGVDSPSKGTVERNCRVSWPMGQSGLQGSLTGRQNAKFICRIHGFAEELESRLAYIQDFSELGKAFDEPVRTYSSGMRARLQFGLSLAIDFDVYISDEMTAAGDVLFKKKSLEAFENLAGRAGLIMVSHNEKVLMDFCTAGICLIDGKLQWFDEIGEALDYYKGSLNIT